MEITNKKKLNKKQKKQIICETVFYLCFRLSLAFHILKSIFRFASLITGQSNKYGKKN